MPSASPERLSASPTKQHGNWKIPIKNADAGRPDLDLSETLDTDGQRSQQLQAFQCEVFLMTNMNLLNFTSGPRLGIVTF
jgi:hypothetical protein